MGRVVSMEPAMHSMYPIIKMQWNYLSVVFSQYAQGGSKKDQNPKVLKALVSYPTIS